MADDEAIAGDVCIPNIGPRQRRIRLVSGIIGIALGFVGLAVLVAFDASPWVRLALFLPFVGGTTGYFQAREKT